MSIRITLALSLLIALVPDDIRAQTETLVLDSAVTLWYNQPSAIHFRGKHDRTYFGYLTLNKELIVTHYDHREKIIGGRQKISEWQTLDDHGAPSIWVVEKGKYKGHILVLYSLHSSPLKIRRSLHREDISEWSEEKILDSANCTYQSVVELSNGEIFIFYTVQTDRRVLVSRSSTDGGSTWSSPKTIIDFGAGTYIYAAPAVEMKDRIYLSWAVYMREGPRKGHLNVYAASSSNAETWSTYGDQVSVNLITPENAKALVETPKGRQNVVWDVKVDRKGYPVIAYVDHAPPISNWTDCVARYLHFDGKVNHWVSDSISSIGSYYYPGGVVIDEKDLSVILSVQRNDRLVLEKWSCSGNTNSWRFAENLVDTTVHTKNFANPVIPKNNHKQLDLIWMDVSQYANKKYACQLAFRINFTP